MVADELKGMTGQIPYAFSYCARKGRLIKSVSFYRAIIFLCQLLQEQIKDILYKTSTADFKNLSFNVAGIDVLSEGR